ncbi:hypothetical protein [Campylobacter curvus]|uniref:hypothetical protein n=1 Tax=Campylobacter curvus TaxID=200 RepID=UPI0014702FA6|nr:hypothetical protein [Campylobacter curvus]
MRNQRVHNKVYLINQKINLAKLPENGIVATLPKNAILMICDVEITQTSDATSFKLGVEGSDEFFIAASALSAKANFKSDKATQLQKDEDIKLSLVGAATKGEIVVRIMFFNPSTYMVEY